jgi:zinc protease
VFTGPVEYTRENRHLISSLTELLQIKLRERLREDLGGTYTVTVGGSAGREPVPYYSIQVSFAADPARLEELTAEVFAEVARLQSSGPANSDLVKVKEAQRRSQETSLEQNGYWLYQLLEADRFGEDARGALYYDDLINGLTRDKLRNAARTYLDSGNYVRVSLYPKPEN